MKEKEFLYRKAEVFIAFLEKKFPGNTFTIEVSKIFNKKGKTLTLSQLRMLDSDFMEMFRDASKPDKKELDTLFQKELSMSFSQLDKKDIRKVNGIIKRGEIKDIDEYYFFKGYQDYLDDNLADQTNKLLGDFELSEKDKSEKL